MLHTIESAPRAAVSNSIATLAQLRTLLATQDWPSKGVAVRAGAVAADSRMSTTLLRMAAGQELRAARLWLRIANYLDQGEQLVAALALAAEFAHRGGNHSAATNCAARAQAAAQLHHVAVPPVLEHQITESEADRRAG